MKTSTFNLDVSDIHCGGCARKATNALSALEGFCEATIDIPTGRVSVRHRGIVETQAIDALHAVGFTASAASA